VFEVIDLADQIVDPLGHVAPQLIRLAELRFEVADALLAVGHLARESRVLVTELPAAIREGVYGAL
jgi:hypothetical protein